ncbi:MAG: hypothetical protein JWM41_891 [Gemmatimonadetes bacterium]|nr:hypothetical protein [Gemmatimonadota bacterium]
MNACSATGFVFESIGKASTIFDIITRFDNLYGAIPRERSRRSSLIPKWAYCFFRT